MKDTVSRDVRRILQLVRSRGDAALCALTRKFDGLALRPSDLRVKPREIRSALSQVPEDLKRALKIAARRIEDFHKRELKNLRQEWSFVSEGLRVGQRARAVDSVGLYVPGGRYPYPSSVLMTAIPARVAGVRRIALVSPPKNLGKEILAAAAICGVDEIYRIGGPAAVAALAFGTKTVRRVDKIVGPGNLYVTEAKRQLYGTVGIDGLAGPSEVVVWADGSADLDQVVVNLLAQAEHDPASRSVLVTSEPQVAREARERTPKEFRARIRFQTCADASRCAEAINRISPEHLLLALSEPRKFLGKVRSAGAIFIGAKTPVPLGDYAAGPSHVLPTGGSARFASGLSVKDFLTWSSVIENRGRKSARAFEAARRLAQAEGLSYHARALGNPA